MVWVVVNTKLLLVQVFDDKDETMKFVEKLNNLEKLYYNSKKSYTFFVERKICEKEIKKLT